VILAEKSYAATGMEMRLAKETSTIAIGLKRMDTPEDKQ